MKQALTFKKILMNISLAFQKICNLEYLILIITISFTKFFSCKINLISSFIGSNRFCSKKLLSQKIIFMFKMMKSNIFPFCSMEEYILPYLCLKTKIMLNYKQEMISDSLTFFFSVSKKKILYQKSSKKKKISKDFSHYKHRANAKFII